MMGIQPINIFIQQSLKVFLGRFRDLAELEVTIENWLVKQKPNVRGYRIVV